MTKLYVCWFSNNFFNFYLNKIAHVGDACKRLWHILSGKMLPSSDNSLMFRLVTNELAPIINKTQCDNHNYGRSGDSRPYLTTIIMGDQEIHSVSGKLPNNLKDLYSEHAVNGVKRKS